MKTEIPQNHSFQHPKNMKNELEIAVNVLQHISEGVMVVNDQGKIIYVNPAFEIVTGYREDEVLNQNPNILQSGLHDKPFYHKMWGDG